MRKLILFILGISFIISGNSQGLNTELGFNNSYNQISTNIIVNNEYSYFLMFESQASGFQNDFSIVKTDTLGNIVWKVPVGNISNEANYATELIAMNDSVILVSGESRPTCDLGLNSSRFIQKFDLTGNLIWSVYWIDPNWTSETTSGLSTNDSTIFINHVKGDTSCILSLDLNGNLIDSLAIIPVNLIQINEFGNFNKIAVSKDSLFAFDILGNTVFSKYFSSDIQNFSIHSDTLFLLTSDSIFSFNSNLLQLNGNYISGFNNYHNLKVGSHNLQFLSRSFNSAFIFTLNHQLQIENVLNIPENIPFNTPVDFNDSHLTASINFDLFDFQTVRLVDYSLVSGENETVNTTDIGIIDILPTSVWLNPHSFPGVYFQKIYADVLIKNYGNNVLNACRINHYINMATCTHFVYSEEFTGLNLAPGDSLWISCGLIHDDLEFLSGDDTLYRNICVYTSHPNSTTDLNVNNDAWCENIVLGFVGIQETNNEEIKIYPNPATDKIYFESNATFHYQIFNAAGEFIFDGKSELEIDIQNLSIGLYFLQIESENGNYNYVKFIKE